jgi:hypothetical protein
MFDAGVLAALKAAEEVRIETTRLGGERPTRRTIIWVVVEGGEVFVRSVRGEAGLWFRELVAVPAARLHVPGLDEPVAVRAAAAIDPASVERCSAALRAKYAPDPALRTMLRPMTLPTTLRLEAA